MGRGRRKGIGGLFSHLVLFPLPKPADVDNAALSRHTIAQADLSQRAERAAKTASLTHKDRVNELNSKLDKLT